MHRQNHLARLFLLCGTVTLIVLTMAWMPTGVNAAPTTYTNSTSAAIPDATGGNCNSNTSNGVRTSTITVSDSYTIDDLNVALNISHTWVSDLVVQLTSPAGTTITLVDRVARTIDCGSSSDNIITMLDDESAGGPVENAAPPTGASYTPQQALSAFDGEAVNGTWTLTVMDVSTDDTGTLNSWSLIVEERILPSSFSVNDVSGAENSGNMTFMVTRGGNLTGTDTVNYATADNSATASSDYSSASGTLTFAPSVNTQTFTVALLNDSSYEGDETFFVNLSDATGANVSISDSQGVGTINDDEVPPGLSVNNVSVAENIGGGQFTVTLNPASASTVTVNYAMANGTAQLGQDYDAASTSGTLTFPPGAMSQSIPFSVIDNTILDGNRQFTVTLSDANGSSITTSPGTATIQDDENPIESTEVPTPPPATAAPPPPAPACADVNFDEASVMRSHFTNDMDRTNVFCRLIVENSNYMTWLGAQLMNSGNIGDQTVLDQGVLQAVDVFSPAGVSSFAGDVNICLKGSGSMIFLAGSEAPRVPQVWSAWTTPSFPGYTCTTLYAPGTVVLVASQTE